MRSAEELKEELSRLKIDIKTDQEIVSRLVEDYNNTDLTDEERENTLQQLEYYAHQVRSKIRFFLEWNFWKGLAHQLWYSEKQNKCFLSTHSWRCSIVGRAVTERLWSRPQLAVWEAVSSDSSYTSSRGSPDTV